MPQKPYENILLINPPLDQEWVSQEQTTHYHPLNLLSILSHLHASGFEGQAQILDHVVTTSKKIDQTVCDTRPDLVGISPNLFSYQNTLHLAELAKSIGADVVLGGNYATLLAKNIIQKQQKRVDFIVSGDGEMPFTKLVHGYPLNEISNLTYQISKETIIQNEVEMHDKPALTPIDYSLIDLNPYFHNYQRDQNPRGLKKPLSILTQKGCSWRCKTGGCVFCSRVYNDTKFEDPLFVWKALKTWKNQFDIDAFMDVGEDFTGNREWLRNLLQMRPKGMEEMAIRHIYGRAGNITQETADILARLNTKLVFLGYESGDDGILKSSNKGGSIGQNIRATKLLEERGIFVHGSFVSGCPGESEKTLKRTQEHIKKLMKLSNVESMSIAPLVPIPGAPAFDMLISDPIMHDKYIDSDEMPVQMMISDWTKRHCSVSAERILEFNEEINTMGKEKGTHLRKQNINSLGIRNVA